MDQLTVTNQLLTWMKEFVEQPHPSLGGWSPCPYARQARLSNNISICQGSDPYADCLSLLYYDWNQEVVIFWYNEIDSADFVSDVNRANQILLSKNIVALEDHPNITEIVSGIKMNFGYCPIIVCQQLDKLTDAETQLRSKGYYETWSQSEIDNIVTWRNH